MSAYFTIEISKKSRSNHKVFIGCCDVLPLRNRGSKIRHLMRNLQQNHSSFCGTINMSTMNLFVFSNLVPRVSRLSDREEGVFLHIKKLMCPGNEVMYLLAA